MGLPDAEERNKEQEPRPDGEAPAVSFLGILYAGAGRAEHPGYAEILTELRKKGSRIVSASAVRLWVTGQVLGPRDGKDIARMGEILDEKSLASDWKSISAALNRIRSIRRGLGRRLNVLILSAHGSPYERFQADDEFSALGLSVDDFADAITLKPIAGISATTEVVRDSDVGILYEGENTHAG